MRRLTPPKAISIRIASLVIAVALSDMLQVGRPCELAAQTERGPIGQPSGLGRSHPATGSPATHHQRLQGSDREAQVRKGQAPNLAPGNQLAMHVLATLERRSRVVSQIRHRVQLGEHILLGSGHYWQQGTGNLRKTRLVMQTQVAGQTASLIQVFDGRYLWTDRQLPSARQVTRLDPVRLQSGLLVGRSTMQRKGRPTAATSLLSAATSRGSLCGQLANLVKEFDFEQPQQVVHNQESRIALLGYWKREELGEVWSVVASELPEVHNSSNQAWMSPDLLAHWPEQLPHHVLLLIGNEDLYPYLIEYRRAPKITPNKGAPHAWQPVDDALARYEQFGVQFAAPIDDRLFDFDHRNNDWVDETAQLIKKLQTARK